MARGINILLSVLILCFGLLLYVAFPQFKAMFLSFGNMPWTFAKLSQVPTLVWPWCFASLALCFGFLGLTSDKKHLKKINIFGASIFICIFIFFVWVFYQGVFHLGCVKDEVDNITPSLCDRFRAE